MGRKVKIEEYTLIHDVWVKMDRFNSLQEKDPNSDCILWTGPKHRQGYGFIGAIDANTLKRKMITLHRFVMRLKLGRELKPGENVIHTCSNPLCCNPDHLIVGDLSKRNEMMYKNGRAPKTRNRKKSNDSNNVQSQ